MDGDALVGDVGADVELVRLAVAHQKDRACGEGIITSLNGVVPFARNKVVDLTVAVRMKGEIALVGLNIQRVMHQILAHLVTKNMHVRSPFDASSLLVYHELTIFAM